MPEAQSLLSIVPLAAIERPACPECQAQMTLARIMPAFRGTDLHIFECIACNYVLETLDASVERPGARLTRRRN
jgi:Zn ribbon nucleic-acid-binding protein